MPFLVLGLIIVGLILSILIIILIYGAPKACTQCGRLMIQKSVNGKKRFFCDNCFKVEPL